MVVTGKKEEIKTIINKMPSTAIQTMRSKIINLTRRS
jgi:hypothetical protein